MKNPFRLKDDLSEPYGTCKGGWFFDTVALIIGIFIAVTLSISETINNFLKKYR